MNTRDRAPPRRNARCVISDKRKGAVHVKHNFLALYSMAFSTVLSEMSTVTTQLRADIRSFQTAAYRPRKSSWTC